MTPYIINYSNEVSTFPAYEGIPGQVNIEVQSLRLRITGQASRNLSDVPSGYYILCDTGDETSQIRKITGINTAERDIVIDAPFTVSPVDTVIRIIQPQPQGEICVYNSGADDLYIDGEILAAGGKILWAVSQGDAPICLYSTGDYQVGNGDIGTASAAPVVNVTNNFSPTNNFAPTNNNNPTNNFSPTNNVSVSVPDGDKSEINTSSSGAVYTLLPAAISNKTEDTVPTYLDMLLLYDNTGGDLNKISMLTVASGYNQMWFRNRKYTFFSDFINPIGTAGGGSDLVSTNSTGSTSNVVTDNNTRVGLVRSTTGASATGRTSPSSASNALRFGGGTWVYETGLNITTLSTGVERFQLIVGFLDTQSAANQVDGVYFLYDEGGVSTGSAASGNWQTCCSSNSVRAFFTTSNAVAQATWVNLRIEVNAAASSVSFYIDGVLVRTETQNIPSGSGRELGFGWLLIKSVGTTARTVDFDYLLVESDFTNSR